MRWDPRKFAYLNRGDQFAWQDCGETCWNDLSSRYNVQGGPINVWVAGSFEGAFKVSAGVGLVLVLWLWLSAGRKNAVCLCIEQHATGTLPCAVGLGGLSSSLLLPCPASSKHPL